MLDDDILTISLEIREKVSYMRSQWSHATPQVTRRLATWNIIWPETVPTGYNWSRAILCL